MKKIMFICLLFVAGFSFSQEKIDARLLEKYSKKELTNMQKNNPNEYQFLINALDKGLFIAEIPTEKGKDIIFNGTLNIDPEQKHTFISLKKEITDVYQYYKIEGTNKMLVILPRIFLDPAQTPKK
jgi:hypothetical protein